jgi:hypothetical protein
MMNVQEFYEQTIKILPTAQRLRLAALILNDIAPSSEVDESDSWTEEDLQDFIFQPYGPFFITTKEAANAILHSGSCSSLL